MHMHTASYSPSAGYCHYPSSQFHQASLRNKAIYEQLVQVHIWKATGRCGALRCPYTMQHILRCVKDWDRNGPSLPLELGGWRGREGWKGAWQAQSALTSSWWGNLFGASCTEGSFTAWTLGSVLRWLSHGKYATVCVSQGTLYGNMLLLVMTCLT